MTVISVIGTVGIPACYGGFESLVQNLVDYQSDSIKYRVYCSGSCYKEKRSHYKSATLCYIPLRANGGSSIVYDICSLINCLFRKTDVTLILGVSGCIFLPFYRVLSKSKVITNIDGLEWKRDKWGYLVRRFLKFSEKLAVKYSDIVISDNEAIAQYVKQEYNVTSVVIAYGGDHAITNSVNDFHQKGDYYLTVCRIEPENNIDLILGSFSKSKEKIKIVGNWNSSTYGRELKEKYSHFANMELLSPIYDVSKLFELRNNCFGYIHGHSAGGTNPSLVEAMHFSMPIYTFDCDFNRHTTENKAFYFKNSKQLNDLLNDAHLDKAKNAFEMKDIASRKYTWQRITAFYEQLY